MSSNERRGSEDAALEWLQRRTAKQKNESSGLTTVVDAGHHDQASIIVDTQKKLSKPTFTDNKRHRRIDNYDEASPAQKLAPIFCTTSSKNTLIKKPCPKFGLTNLTPLQTNSENRPQNHLASSKERATVSPDRVTCRRPTSMRRRWQCPEPERYPRRDGDVDIEEATRPAFRTARQQLLVDVAHGVGKARNAMHEDLVAPSASSYGSSRRTLGSVRNGFRPPLSKPLDTQSTIEVVREDIHSLVEDMEGPLKNIDSKMVELVKSEIMDQGALVDWNDIAGLEFVKTIVKEIVVFPLLRPDIFTGLRSPPKGILLFGPPGTGKTLIGKCIASRSKSTFFSISASSLTSKWVGEGEKMVRALFAVAKVYQPSVVFIDEIDSLLSQRSDSEHESSRRIKTEFLVQLDGASTVGAERILVVGATNRPHDLDEAARRRLVKRLYVPLPEHSARLQIVRNLLKDQSHCLTASEMETISKETEGYSGADMASLCQEAAMGPIRSLDYSNMEAISLEDVRAINYQDFTSALSHVKASVSTKDLSLYHEWNKKFGCGGEK